MPFINGQTGYLGELLDVFTGDAGAASGDFLTFDGHDWTQSRVPSYLGEILDVTTGNGASSGEYLRFNGHDWEPYDASSIDNLAERVFNLELEQALRPTNADVSAAMSSLSNRFNNLNASDSAQTETLNKLVQGFASIKKSLNDLNNLYTAHTGVSGAHDL